MPEKSRIFGWKRRKPLKLTADFTD